MRVFRGVFRGGFGRFSVFEVGEEFGGLDSFCEFCRFLDRFKFVKCGLSIIFFVYF